MVRKTIGIFALVATILLLSYAHDYFAPEVASSTPLLDVEIGQQRTIVVPAASIREAFPSAMSDGPAVIGPVPLLSINEYYSPEQVADHFISINPKSRQTMTAIVQTMVIADPMPQHDCIMHGSVCTEVVNTYTTRPHPYYSYPSESLESLAPGDAAAAQVLAERYAAQGENEVAIEYALQSAASSSKVGALFKLWETYGQQLHEAITRAATADEIKPIEAQRYLVQTLMYRIGPVNALVQKPHPHLGSDSAELDAKADMLLSRFGLSNEASGI